MCRPVSVLNRNSGSFVQHRNKILHVGYVSSLPLSLTAVVCVFLWSTYASYWSDRCSPQQSQFPPPIGDGRRKGGSQERQMRDRGKKGGKKRGMMVSDRVGENEEKRKKGESLWGKGGGGVIERNGVGGGVGGEAGREKGRSYEC